MPGRCRDLEEFYLNDETKRALVETGLVTAKQLQEVAGKGPDSDFIAELIKISGLAENDFYQGLSKAYRMPYVDLTGKKMAPGAKLVIADDCMTYWNFFPVDYDPKSGLMTLAVSSPEQAEKLETVFRFLMESFDNGYVFTSEKQLTESVARDCGSSGPGKISIGDAVSGAKRQVPIPTVNRKVAGKTKVAIPLPKKKPSGEPKTEALKLASIPASKSAPAPPVPVQPDTIPDEIIKSLTSAVSLLVNAHIGGDMGRATSVKARVRYCQLTATRLGLTPVQTTKVILSAWLSALSDRKDVIREFVSPYDLEEIIFAEESGRGLGVESLILTLVRSYQELEKESPDDAKDVNLARRGLFMKWGAAAKHQDVLETFLQVLMDEQFVDKLGRHVGHIVIIGSPSEEIAEVERAMGRSGYGVKVLSSVADAEAAIEANGADLLVVSASGDGEQALDSCARLKGLASAKDIPLMAVVCQGATVKGTECLRGGADDFVDAPIDVELLFLKAERLMAVPARREESEGVSGSLADMSFSDLVQVLSAGGKSMDVSVTNGEEDGRIVLKSGNVVHAEAGNISGEAAFYALMQWKVGQFSMSECQEFPETTVTSSTMSLLMEGARIADEGQAGVS